MSMFTEVEYCLEEFWIIHLPTQIKEVFKVSSILPFKDMG